MLEFSKFVVVRAVLAVFTLVLVSFIVFSLMELVPGDCAERYLAFKNSQGAVISAADIDAERIRLGLMEVATSLTKVLLQLLFNSSHGV